MKRAMTGWLAAVAAGGTLWAADPPLQALSTNKPARVESEDLYRALRLNLYSITNDLSVERFGHPFVFSENDRCNFTYVSPSAADVTCSPDGLRFRATSEETVIGWGNYDNRQPRAERVPMFPGWNSVELEVSQSATGSTWQFTLWMDGVPKLDRNRRAELGSLSLSQALGGTFEARVKGTERQTIRFRAYRGQPDGFGLRITGPAGNEVTIHGLRVKKVRQNGYFRHRVTLPPGRAIWRAVGEVSGVRLFVNGREADFMPQLLKTQGDARTYPVDLAPLLKPGAVNTLAIDPAGSSFVYLQGRAVLDDGTVIGLDTGPDWKGALEPADGWIEPGFEDADWLPVATAPAKQPGNHHLNARWPVHDGRLLLENPGPDPKLYYDDSAPIRVQARIPGGWAGPRPELRWTLRRVERDTTRPTVGRGIVKPDTAQAVGGSLVYGIEAGPLAWGVYTLETELAADGAVVEHRFEEPLIVVGRLPMQEVSGDTYEEGMTLTLEDTIDFTDPKDRHRWIERATSPGLKAGEPGRTVTEPRIVRKPGLVYREVAEAGGASFFSYQFQFQRPYSWYLMVLEYPNDAARRIGVAVTCLNYSQCGPSVLTGGKFPLDDRLHELKWVHWADAEPHTLDVVTLARGEPAAAARVRMYRIEDPELPALKVASSGARYFGIHTERARSLGATFGDTSGRDMYQNLYAKWDYDLVDQFTQRVRWQAEAARNYTAYLRFSGQNVHVMGAFQYHEGNTAYVPPERIAGDGRVLQDIREHALRYFERNGVAMYSLVEYIEHRAMRVHFTPSDEDVARGADTLAFVSREGKQGGWCVNPNHPAAELGYLHVAEDLALKFAHSPAWRGLFYNVGDGTFGPVLNAPARAPFDYDYSDATLARFEQETGIRVPGGTGPDRFRLRYLFLTSDVMREDWIEWRCRNMGSYLVKTRDLLRRHRPDLNVLCNWHLHNAIRFWLTDAPGPYGDYARQLGMNPAVVRDEPGIWFGRTLYPVGSSHGGRNSDVWAHNVDPSVIAYYDMPNRLVVLNTCWYELTTRPGEVEDWPVTAHASRFIGQASGDYALESFTQALIGADPDVLLFGFTDVNIINSREQQARDVARALTPLPKEKFEAVLGTADFKHNLAIRALRKGADLWFYAANPGYWPIRGELELSGPAPVERAQDGQPVETKPARGRTAIPVELGPYGLAAFRARAPGIEIAGWTNAPVAESELAHMRGIMAEVRGLLDTRETVLALARPEREWMRAVCAAAEEHLAGGRYAAAWSELTNWRFWELWRKVLVPAQTRGARLEGRPEPEEAWTLSDKPVLRVARVAGVSPASDGKLDDPAWRQAEPSFRFLSLNSSGMAQLGYPLMDMSVQALYDDRALYLGLRMADPDVNALKHTASAENPIEVLRKYDDAVVVFLSPDGQRLRQFAVNAGGIKYCAASGSWNVDQGDVRKLDWQATTGSKPGEWVIEAAIPFAELDVEPPRAGVEWAANFLRRFREFGTIPETYWARISQWDRADQYGALVFQ